MSGGGMFGGVASSAMSLAAMAAGPFGGIAASALSMFGLGRPHVTMPSMRDTWALEGTKAATSIAAQTPSFELSYADVSGVDPDAYEPVLVKIVPTSDNWRVVVQTERQLSRGGMSAPTFSERHVPIHIESLGRGHVRISAEAPLEPGEYGVALRPLKHDDAGQSTASPMSMISRTAMVPGTGSMAATPAELWQSVWDFAVEATSPVPQPEK